MQTWVRGDLDEKAQLAWWEELYLDGRNTAASAMCSHRVWWVKNEKSSRLNINKICWYKRSTWCYGGKVWGELHWELYLLETLFSKLVLALNVIKESSWEHMRGFSSSAADLSCQFVEWFIGSSFWRIIVSISQNEKWFRIPVFLFQNGLNSGYCTQGGGFSARFWFIMKNQGNVGN